jgi:hypothetical protein
MILNRMIFYRVMRDERRERATEGIDDSKEMWA